MGVNDVRPAGPSWPFDVVGAEETSASETYRLMFEPFVARSPIGVAVLDSDLRYVWVNEVLEYHGAVPRDQRFGRRITEVFPGEDAKGFEVQVRRVLESGTPVLDYEFRARIPTRQFREYTYRISCFPIEGAAGQIRAVWYMATDVTDHWRARERLLLLNEAGVRVGSTLDAARTAQELADVVVPRFADFAAVDLLDPVPEGLGPVGNAPGL